MGFSSETRPGCYSTRAFPHPEGPVSLSFASTCNGINIPFADNCKGLLVTDSKALMQMPAQAFPMAERDDDSGRYTETYPPEEFVDALDALGGAAGTQDIADEVGCKYRTANAKLHELEDAGRISSKKVGNAYLWELREG